MIFTNFLNLPYFNYYVALSYALLGVHTILNDLLPTNVYYRINPYLTEVVSMTEIRPEKLKMLEQDVQMYIRRNDDKLREVALILTKPRSRVQRTNDWVSLQKVLFDLWFLVQFVFRLKVVYENFRNQKKSNIIYYHKYKYKWKRLDYGV